MNKDQQVNDGRLEADHMRFDYRNFTDDEEVMLLPHRKDTDVPNHPGSDIPDGPDTSDTQRDDWLLKTKPLQRARPRWNEGKRPPVVDDQSGFLDLEAVGGVGGSESGKTGNPGPSAVPRSADITGGRGDYTTEGGGGGVRLLSLTCHQEGRELCLRFLWMSDHVTVVRTDGRMLGRR